MFAVPNKRMAISISTVAVVLLLACSGAVVWYAWQQESGPPAEPTGVSKLLTLDGAQTQTRLDLPDGTTLLHGMFYVEVDWTVAVQARFNRAALPGFLAKNGLPAPVNGLRPVPGLVPMPPPALAVPTGSADPSAPAAAASPAAAPQAAPSPARPLLQDAADWHPERPTSVSGIPRNVRNGVARWMMFDLDDPATITIYVIAAADVPASLTASASPGGSPGR